MKMRLPNYTIIQSILRRSTPIYTIILLLALNHHHIYCTSAAAAVVSAASKETSNQYGLAEFGGKIMAFADVNSDSRTDLIYVFDDTKIGVLLASHDANEAMYSEGNEELIIDLKEACPAAAEIQNIMAADYNYDGYIDLAVTYRKKQQGEDDNGSTDNNYFTHIFTGDAHEFKELASVGEGFTSQASVIQADGNNIPDFYGETVDVTGNLHRGFWMYQDVVQHDEEVENRTTAETSIQYKYMDHQQQEVGPSAPRISNPHSNAFVDLNGDCLPDLLVTTMDSQGNNAVGIEIWLNTEGSGFVREPRNILQVFAVSPKFDLNKMGLFSFADMNADGAIDIVVPYCDDEDMFRANSGFFSSSKMSTCSSSSILIFYNLAISGNDCIADTSYGFSLEKYSVVRGLGNYSHLIRTHAENISSDPPPSVQIGDYNLDGYPDLLLVMCDREVSNRKVIILDNIPCNPNPNPNPNSGPDGDTYAVMKECYERTLESNTEIALELDSLPATPLIATFFDFGDDASLDILVISKGRDGSHSSRVIEIPNRVHDSFFAKVFVLNGHCISWCRDGTKFPNPEPVGAFSVGGVVSLTFDDVHSNKEVRKVSSISRTSFNAYPLPYSIIGLGRTSNYIKAMEVTVPYTQNKKKNSHTFRSVIPNSQLIVIPYEPDHPENWALRLYLIPGNVILWVGVGTIVSCLCMFLTVAALHLKERYQDDSEKKATNHLFNYRAL